VSLPFPVLPSLDLALINFLATHTALAPFHGGRVGTSLTTGQPWLTAIRVANLGGPDTWPWEANADFQIECWGGSMQQVDDLDRTVCSAIYGIRGPITGGYITVAHPTLRHLWQPDANGRPRYISQVHLEATPPAPT
jgi:hypothetical protein